MIVIFVTLVGGLLGYEISKMRLGKILLSIKQRGAVSHRFISIFNLMFIPLSFYTVSGIFGSEDKYRQIGSEIVDPYSGCSRLSSSRQYGTLEGLHEHKQSSRCNKELFPKHSYKEKEDETVLNMGTEYGNYIINALLRKNNVASTVSPSKNTNSQQP